MSVSEVVRNRLNERGTTIAALARRTGIDANVLSRCLREKQRFKVEELFLVCDFLDLDLDDVKNEILKKDITQHEETSEG